MTVLTEFPNHPHGVISEEYKGRWIAREKRDGYHIIRVPVLVSPRKTFVTRLLFYLSFMVMSFIVGLTIRSRCDVLLATSPPIFVGLSGSILAAIKRAKFVLDVRDLWPAAAVELGELRARPAIRIAEHLESHLYRRAELITTTTKGFSRHISELTRVRTEALPNGTDPEIFHPGRPEPSLRSRLGLNGKTVVGFAGLLGIAQDLEVILEVAAMLRNEKGLAFLFLGSGPMEDRLKDKVASMGLENVVLHRQVPVEQVTPYLLSCEILLVTLCDNPLFSMFVPSKVFDYMACERPVIVNVAGETERLVEQSRAGVVVPGGDPGALARAIKLLMEDDGLRAAMGRNGRAFVKAHYDRRVIGDRLAELLERL